MTVVKISELPQKDALEDGDKVIAWNSANGATSVLLGTAFTAIKEASATSASAAKASENAAKNLASEASSSADSASESASGAALSAEAAKASETNALASANSASASQTQIESDIAQAKLDITTERTAAVSAVEAAQATAISSIQTQGTESVTAVTDAKATSVSAVKAQEAASIQAIEADSVLAGYAKATDVAATYLPLTGGTMSLGSETGIKFNGQAQICSYMDGAVCIRNLKDPTMPKIYMDNLGSGGGTLSYTNPGDYFAFSAVVKAPSFQTTSDARKKTGLTPVHPDLSGLTAYRYTLKDDGKTHVGLVAQEVEKVIPEAVSEDKEGFLALDYNAVVAALVDEVNRLRERVEALEAAE